MNRRLYLILFLLLGLPTTFSVFGQRDAANWYFGNFAGLDFNSGVPQVLTDSSLDTIEGCSSISDKDTGQLLFYTEGTTIWNRAHEIMLNGEGILGSLSSTQSAVIVPLPGSSSLFYVFTTDEVQAYQNNGVGNGINYSVVSMSGGGGLGEVIEKNVPLLPEGSEKISVVETADGVNFWIVTHFEDRFYAFLLDDTGVAPAIVSPIGPNIDNFENFRGAMKLSPNGSKLAIAHCITEPSIGGFAYLYDFNNTTGEVTNQVLLSDDLIYYGVEFSSDSSKLYFSGKTIVPVGEEDSVIIEQYDVTVSSIPNTRFTISEVEDDLLSDLAGALQIAMDRKIYYAFPGPNISVINNPKLQGDLANFSMESVELGLSSSSFGLPQYIQSFFESFVTIEGRCEDDSTNFIVDTNAQIIGASWDFGDPASGADNTSNDINTSHFYTEPGLYTVTVEFSFSNRAPKTFIEFVRISPKIDFPDTISFTQCDADGANDGIAIFNLIALMNEIAPVNNLQYQFYNSFEDAELGQNPIVSPTTFVNTFSNQTIYVVIDNEASCNGIIPIQLNVSAISNDLNFTYSLCEIRLSQFDVWIAMMDLADEIIQDYPGGEVSYYSSMQNAILQFSEITSNTVPSTVSGFGGGVYYRVSISTDNVRSCEAVGYITFDIINDVTEEDKFLNFCSSDGSLALVLDDQYATYEWSTGETTPTITVDSEGMYFVMLKGFNDCEGTIQFTVTEVGNFELDVQVTDFQQYNSIIATPTDSSLELFYSINGGVTFEDNGNFQGLPAGNYSLVVIGAQNCNEYSQFIEIRGAPRYFTPNGDGTHDYWHVNDARNYAGMVVKIFDRYGKQLYQMNNTSIGWDGVYNGVEMPTNAYWYSIAYEGQEYYGHFTLIRR